MVVLTYVLVLKLFSNQKAALLSSLLLAISPWSLQLSRAAFEAHLAAMLNLAGITSFVYCRKKKWLLPVAIIFFVASFYTFNSNRIIAPLLILLLTVLYRFFLFSDKKWTIVSIIIGLLLILPTISYFQTRESRLRFTEVSIFNNLDTIQKSNARISRSGSIWWAKILYNRRVYFIREFLKHYLDHFKGEYLFIKGDRNPRLSIQDVGELYLFELPFLIYGLFKVAKLKSKTSLLLLGWLLIAPVPAGMAKETPHMLRTASALPVWQIFTAAGLVYFWHWLKSQHRLLKNIILISLSIIITGNIFYYLH
ncbi:MAG: glycosyl transferase family 39, partial [uncultured bacterium]